MEKAATSTGLPWGTIVAAGGVAAFGTGFPFAVKPFDQVSFAAVVLVVLAALALFMIGRLLLNPLSGLLMAVLLIVHPLWHGAGFEQIAALHAELLKLFLLLCMIVMWRLALGPKSAFFSSLGLGVVCSIFAGWAWLTTPEAGWTALVFQSAALLVLVIIAVLRRRSESVHQNPPLVNVCATILLALMIPALSVLTVIGVSRLCNECERRGWQQMSSVIREPAPDDATWQSALETAWQPYNGSGYAPGTTWPEIQKWAWPWYWLVFPLIALGLFRALWRGGMSWSEEPPCSWLLFLFAAAQTAAVMLHPGSFRNTALLPLAMLSALLMVFGAGDLLRGIGQQMVLHPPEAD